MAKARKSKTETENMDAIVEIDNMEDAKYETKDTRKIKDLEELMDFEIKTLDDFKVYNKAARRLGRPVKVPDESYHKKIKVKFQRFDQPENVLKACLVNADIDWQGQLKPGSTYELPWPVIKWLNDLAVPIFSEVKSTQNGETIVETKQTGTRNRFSCQILEM